MSDPLLHQAANLPTAPGVYLFKDGRQRVLYVGKAVNLRSRVRQYLAGHDSRTMVPFLVRAAKGVECIRTLTEKEALLLENSLIKKHRPRYNTKLRDDTNFLHLRLDLKHKWPRYRLVRRIKDDGAKYFGPYHSASKARATLEFLQRAFPLRTCTDAVLKSRKRPCLLHQMDRCVAPCVDRVTREEYRQLADQSTDLLAGRTPKAIASLRSRMLTASEEEQFEKAARIRDLIRSIEASVERQHVIDTKLGDRDLWGLYREGDRGAVAILPVRNGVMGEPRTSILDPLVGSDAEVLSTLLNTTYRDDVPIPSEIGLNTDLPDREALVEVLSERRGKKVQIRTPKRGKKARLLGLALENARIYWLAQTDEEARHRNAMSSLAEALELPEPPRRIECFDNSNLQGTHPVAAMSVFIHGKPDRREYRRYKVKTVTGSDDYATMREILERRFRRAIDEDNHPDLLLVDGGKGQLGVAMAVLEDLGLFEQAVAGIAKPRTERRRGDRQATDKIVLPHRKEPLKLGRNHPGLRILQHIRDEAHNHAVRYHRKVRGRSNLVSVLEGIPGVGPSRRKALLRGIGSAERVASAEVHELAAVDGIGPTMAQQIYDAFRS